MGKWCILRVYDDAFDRRAHIRLLFAESKALKTGRFSESVIPPSKTQFSIYLSLSIFQDLFNGTVITSSV